MANPFEDLGLAPLAIRGKTDDQIRRLVHLVGRALSQMEHPDAGGEEKRFHRIRNALEALQDQEKFELAKARFLKTGQSKSSQLENMLAKSVEELSFARDQFREYILSFNAPAVMNVVRPSAVTLTIRDTVKNQFKSPAFVQKMHVFKLLVKQGGMTEDRDGVQKQLTRTLVGCIRYENLLGNKNIIELLTKCQDEGTEPTRRVAPPNRTTNITVRPAKRVGERKVQFERAEPILDLLRPEMVTNGHLFSLLRQDELSYLYYEGTILSITKS